MIGGCTPPPPTAISPGIELDRSRGATVHLHVQRVARRVERLRGLRFRRVPKVVVVQPVQLTRISNDLRRGALARIAQRPGGIATYRSHVRAQDGFETLAGLLPAADATDASGASASEQIGGAYDYRRHRVLLIDRVAATHKDVERILAHELTHALEDEHFNLQLLTARGSSQRAQARRALIEGTATFVATRYDGLYLHNQLPVGLRLAGQRSVFAAGGSTPFAVKANTIFDYVDGPIFVQRLYRRAHGWRLVNRALREPPPTTRGILHSSIFPRLVRGEPVGLRLESLLAPARTRTGTGVAGEEDMLSLLTSGAPDQVATAAANGWRGGRFEIWRLAGGDCSDPCIGEDVAVMAIRLRAGADRAMLRDAFLDYSLLARLGDRAGTQTWHFLSGGYGALRVTGRSAAIAFAPTQELASSVAARAALEAAP